MAFNPASLESVATGGASGKTSYLRTRIVHEMRMRRSCASYLLVFSNYEVTEGAPYLGETRAWIGDATWKPLDRATVETLVSTKV